MRGCIKERCGAWALIFDLPRVNGKRRQKFITVRGSKDDAQRELDRLIAEAHGLASLPPISTLYRGNRHTATRYVYVVGNSANRLVKIGRSVNVEERVKELQSMSPVAVSLLWHTEAKHLAETDLHQYCSQYRVRGEWFDFGDEDPVAYIKEVVDGLRDWNPQHF